MQKYEYQVIELLSGAPKAKDLNEIANIFANNFNSVLNKYGLEGWELVGVTSTTIYWGIGNDRSNPMTQLFAFFKKPKE
jgi:hypothetical protein